MGTRNRILAVGLIEALALGSDGDIGVNKMLY